MKILVAHDGSEQADLALKKAADLASKTNASIVVLSVVPDLCMTELSDDECRSLYNAMTEEAKRHMARVKEDLTKSGLEVMTEVKFGSPAETIIDVAQNEKVDMIVVGSHGRHGAKKFLLGSVSSKVVDHAPCEVLIVK